MCFWVTRPKIWSKNFMIWAIIESRFVASFESDSLRLSALLVLQRPYTCPVENCGKSYKRQDHLNRHSLTHKGKLFLCPVKGCDVSFTMTSNLQRHVGLHEKWDSELLSGQKEGASDSLKCPEPCCGKKFKYPSLLQTHMENVHG